MFRIPAGYKGPKDEASLKKMLKEHYGAIDSDDDEPPSAEHEENALKLDLK